MTKEMLRTNRALIKAINDLGVEGKPKRQAELEKLQRQIEGAFCETFGLRKCSPIGINPGLRHGFDHCTYYRKSKDDRLVIVSQPYDKLEEEAKDWAASNGVKFEKLFQWGWYYPGYAKLIALTFTKNSESKLKEV